jgi:hypothetical protein
VYHTTSLDPLDYMPNGRYGREPKAPLKPTWRAWAWSWLCRAAQWFRRSKPTIEPPPGCILAWNAGDGTIRAGTPVFWTPEPVSIKVNQKGWDCVLPPGTLTQGKQRQLPDGRWELSFTFMPEAKA